MEEHEDLDRFFLNSVANGQTAAFGRSFAIVPDGFIRVDNRQRRELFRCLTSV